MISNSFLFALLFYDKNRPILSFLNKIKFMGSGCLIKIEFSI